MFEIQIIRWWSPVVLSSKLEVISSSVQLLLSFLSYVWLHLSDFSTWTNSLTQTEREERSSRFLDRFRPADLRSVTIVSFQAWKVFELVHIPARCFLKQTRQSTKNSGIVLQHISQSDETRKHFSSAGDQIQRRKLILKSRPQRMSP